MASTTSGQEMSWTFPHPLPPENKQQKQPPRILMIRNLSKWLAWHPERARC
ncbi:hypothetical protein [Enterobacter ludwigii]|uniref:hypothetical protein n=1 Tax=Enterobacter ludwigii TaxID=299767 RepID=UPI001D0094DA|nr:hypothetical protein [Enterobacter ludwigii]